MIKTDQYAPVDYLYRQEQSISDTDWLDRLQNRLIGKFELNPLRLKIRARRFVKSVAKHAKKYESYSEQSLIDESLDLGVLIRKEGFSDLLVSKMFAIIREMSGRVLAMKHFDSQLKGGWVIMQGRIAEMKTGEGKTLTAVLPVITAAISGLPVHVITVNDYLTERDAQEMTLLYQKFGLSVGLVTHQVSPEQRRVAYRADILYITGKELVFDYLRDQMKMDHCHTLRLHVEALKRPKFEQQLQLRGLHFAIVDEADSVLIDESRTPLIISGTQSNEGEQHFIEEAWQLSSQLTRDQDYSLDEQRREIELTDIGTQKIRKLSEDLGALWRGAIRREEIVLKALQGRFIYQRDKDYLVREGKVELIDPLTGRVMEGRSWEKGLHQMIELKEGCELTEQRVTQARISYQSFFRRYLNLSGMTGTAWEVKQELWNTYRLPVTKIATHRKERRITYAPKVFLLDTQRWKEVIDQCQKMIAQGRAILIGTNTVADSDIASQFLTQANIEHFVLSAKQDKQEAEVVAAAGFPGRVMVATNMAGRGTDIKLHVEVKKSGGLHVILTDLYESGRVDRQLSGRSARQGDPGSFQMLLSLENLALKTMRAKSLIVTAKSVGLMTNAGQKLALQAVLLEQKFTERQNYLARQSTLEFDLKQVDLLAFSGKTK